VQVSTLQSPLDQTFSPDGNSISSSRVSFVLGLSFVGPLDIAVLLGNIVAVVVVLIDGGLVYVVCVKHLLEFLALVDQFPLDCDCNEQRVDLFLPRLEQLLVSS